MNPTAEKSPKLRWHARLSLLTIIIGVSLLVIMIIVEDEPGAIPLFLILAGTAWFLFTRYRIRSRQK